MMCKPLQFKDLSLVFPNKSCFKNFSAFLPYGSRVAIIGKNGCGKSSLLKIINRELQPSAGKMIVPKEALMAFVPQIIENYNHLSGAQRFNANLAKALRTNPKILLLDEPTNHLDAFQRKSLIRVLMNYSGTLMIATHDDHLIDSVTETLWHIHHDSIQVFTGNYNDYMNARENERYSLEQEIVLLNRQKAKTHNALMKEQKRAKQSKLKGQNSIERRKWPTIVSKCKANRASKTSGNNRLKITQQKEKLNSKLSCLQTQKIIIPKFLVTGRHEGNKVLVSIREGQLGYYNNNLILKKINLDIRSCERIAILGENGSGKSTLLKGIMNDSRLIKEGQWRTIAQKDIGYLDQHYNNLEPEMNSFEHIAKVQSDWTSVEIRHYLSDVLFRKNEEVFLKAKYLSGGEKCRLSLAKLACQTPKLIILDEITNNIDFETRNHVVEVFRNFPAALLVVSHDVHFLNEIGIEKRYEINVGILYEQS